MPIIVLLSNLCCRGGRHYSALLSLIIIEVDTYDHKFLLIKIRTDPTTTKTQTIQRLYDDEELPPPPPPSPPPVADGDTQDVEVSMYIILYVGAI